MKKSRHFGRVKQVSLFLIYLTFYAVWRLGIDFIREGRELLFGLHEAQLISIVVLIITITLMALKTRWVKKGEGEEALAP